MEESRCSAPGCGARIGGRNHNSAVGTVRIGVGGETESPGYIPIPENDDESSIARLVLRFYVHSSIYLSTFQKKNRKILQKIIRTDESQLESISDVVREKLELDYSRMKLKTQFADDDLAMALHQVFKAFSIPDIMNIDLRQANSRSS